MRRIDPLIRSDNLITIGSSVPMASGRSSIQLDHVASPEPKPRQIFLFRKVSDFLLPPRSGKPTQYHHQMLKNLNDRGIESERELKFGCRIRIRYDDKSFSYPKIWQGLSTQVTNVSNSK